MCRGQLQTGLRWACDCNSSKTTALSSPPEERDPTQALDDDEDATAQRRFFKTGKACYVRHCQAQVCCVLIGCTRLLAFQVFTFKLFVVHNFIYLNGAFHVFIISMYPCLSAVQLSNVDLFAGHVFI